MVIVGEFLEIEGLIDLFAKLVIAAFARQKLICSQRTAYRIDIGHKNVVRRLLLLLELP